MFLAELSPKTVDPYSRLLWACGSPIPSLQHHTRTCIYITFSSAHRARPGLECWMFTVHSHASCHQLSTPAMVSLSFCTNCAHWWVGRVIMPPRPLETPWFTGLQIVFCWSSQWALGMASKVMAKKVCHPHPTKKEWLVSYCFKNNGFNKPLIKSNPIILQKKWKQWMDLLRVLKRGSARWTYSRNVSLHILPPAFRKAVTLSEDLSAPLWLIHTSFKNGSICAFTAIKSFPSCSRWFSSLAS